ncbi:hemolysin III family protein [Alteromonadaceae bacterium BrNp21-10]|nr:hemolysin III family protein [Alteromonadaceae bacterium BrNp21-10]
MSVASNTSAYSTTEEWLNSISHGVGFIIAVFGLVYIVLKADNILEIAATSIYSSSLLMMLLTSTLYHSVRNAKAKKTLKLLDHSAIYLLIAGTNTPFLLITIGGQLGVGLTIAIWCLAVFGVSFKCWAKGRYPKVSVATYLLMGWFALLIIYPLYNALPSAGFWLLVAGGVFFNIGVLFYVAKKHKYTHAIWHLFVLAGCTCHYLSIYLFVI